MLYILFYLRQCASRNQLDTVGIPADYHGTFCPNGYYCCHCYYHFFFWLAEFDLSYHFHSSSMSFVIYAELQQLVCWAPYFYLFVLSFSTCSVPTCLSGGVGLISQVIPVLTVTFVIRDNYAILLAYCNYVRVCLSHILHFSSFLSFGCSLSLEPLHSFLIYIYSYFLNLGWTPPPFVICSLLGQLYQSPPCAYFYKISVQQVMEPAQGLPRATKRGYKAVSTSNSLHSLWTSVWTYGSEFRSTRKSGPLLDDRTVLYCSRPF